MKTKKKKTKKKTKSKVAKLTAINAKVLSKAQKRHIKDFGELHPLDASDFYENGSMKVKKVSFMENNPSQSDNSKTFQEKEYVDSEEEEEVDPYQKLVGSLGSNVRQKYLQMIKNDEEMDDDSDNTDDVEDYDDDDVEDIESDMEVYDKITEESTEANESEKEEGKSERKKTEMENQEVESDTRQGDDDDYSDDDDDNVEDYRQENCDDESDNEDVNDNIIEQDEQDPFTVHFEQDLDDDFETKILDPKAFEQKTNIVSSLGTVTTFVPTFKVPMVYGSSNKTQTSALFKVKNRLRNSWRLSNKSAEPNEFTPLQKKLFPYINSYQDVLYSNRSFDNGEDISKLYCLHAVNHILKTRSRVLKNNAKIVLAQKENKEVDDLRDQGLTRPKVLILVPFRNSALKIVNIIIDLLLPNGEGQVMSKKRFQEEYSDSGASDTKRSFRPVDFEKMFEGNIDDCFRIGLSIMRKAVKLYSHFYSSDILIASPLGLRTILGSDGEKFGDCDFLSSIEVLILDQADVYLMQNWEHIQHIFDNLHKQPKKAHDVDFSRVRNWCLNGWSKYYRQTLFFGSFFFPELNSLLNKQCHNFAGKTKIQLTELPGTICQVVTQVPQVFYRIECSSHAESQEKTFNFFVEKILPEFRGHLMGHTAIFVPSYFDFVRLRNFFRQEEISFTHISEYSKRSDITRARNWFLEGSKAFMLYTERFYFFYRYRIKGIRNIIFYGLPRYSHFYPEILNFLDTGNTGSQSAAITTPVTCTALYTKYDSHRLAETVGSRRCCHMISSHKKVHMFVTGEKSTL
ncbi:digestive organ expansion factor homolog isoform X2 [Actinia tenebrosa]|uniref:U3 small nucleolar RNA-associated protein 25 homolog n=1 Tax=Actinia tenebrosa TaxID=6105 RepID=A0A6P8HGK9_ACTTE|nr:digestive organ expansion factor homolog isoform X2 [Actinia tenebrosa]